MKKIIGLLLVFVMVLSLCACGGGTEEKKSSPKDAVIEKIKNRIIAEIALSYDTVGAPTITAYASETEENVFEISGKVTVKDSYGNKYTGQYDAIVEYNPTTEVCYVKDYDLGTLYKD